MFYYQLADMAIYAYAYLFAAIIVFIVSAAAGVLLGLYDLFSGEDVFGGDGDED